MILPNIICSQVGDFQSAKIILFLKKICFSCAKLGKSLKRLRLPEQSPGRCPVSEPSFWLDCRSEFSCRSLSRTGEELIFPKWMKGLFGSDGLWTFCLEVSRPKSESLSENAPAHIPQQERKGHRVPTVSDHPQECSRQLRRTTRLSFPLSLCTVFRFLSVP